MEAEDASLQHSDASYRYRYTAEPQGRQKYRKGTLAAMATQQIALMCLIYKPMKRRKAKNIEGTAHEQNPTRGRAEASVSGAFQEISCPRAVVTARYRGKAVKRTTDSPRLL